MAAYRDVTASVIGRGMRNLKIIILHSPWTGAGNFSKSVFFWVWNYLF